MRAFSGIDWCFIEHSGLLQNGCFVNVLEWIATACILIKKKQETIRQIPNLYLQTGNQVPCISLFWSTESFWLRWKWFDCQQITLTIFFFFFVAFKRTHYDLSVFINVLNRFLYVEFMFYLLIEMNLSNLFVMYSKATTTILCEWNEWQTMKF